MLDSSRACTSGIARSPPYGVGTMGIFVAEYFGLFWVCSEVRVVWWLCPSPLEYLCFASS